MMRTDVELLQECTKFMIQQIQLAETEILNQLQTRSDTSLLTALRIFRLQRSVQAIGIFQMFESLTQRQRVGKMSSIKDELIKQEKFELAHDFKILYQAINVLKHGTGESYLGLLKNNGRIRFKIKKDGENFFQEGDVSEVEALVDLDDSFLLWCSKTLEETYFAIKDADGKTTLQNPT